LVNTCAAFPAPIISSSRAQVLEQLAKGGSLGHRDDRLNYEQHGHEQAADV
jgi:hypothetical protein